MKRTVLIIIIIVGWGLEALASGIGVPFFKNFTSVVYNAHKLNYDVVCDDYGTVYVANFEGLLYYDGSTWRKIHTPGISRVTRLAKGDDGRIWVGGFNVFGYLYADDRGCLRLKTILSDAGKKTGFAEVDEIRATKGNIYVHFSNGKAYTVKNNTRLVPIKNPKTEVSDTVYTVTLPHGFKVSYDGSSGLDLYGGRNKVSITENDGLLSNTVNSVAFDSRNILWGATERGLFQVETLTPLSCLTERQNLRGEVNCITQLGDCVYIGTMNGIYVSRANKLSRIDDNDLACWQFEQTVGGVLAATSDGLKLITGQCVRQITKNNTLSVCVMSNGGYITGELDGVYLVSTRGERTYFCPIQKATGLKELSGVLHVKTIYGQQWNVNIATRQAKCIRQGLKGGEPKLTYTDQFGSRWKTDAEGKNITVKGRGMYDDNLVPWIFSLRQRALNCMYVTREGNVWFGGDFGVVVIDGAMVGTMKLAPVEKPAIRCVVDAQDSIVWGGYSKGTMKPIYKLDNLDFQSDCHQLTVYFSTCARSVVRPTQYRYRLNERSWSQWSEETELKINNLSPGAIMLEIQAKDAYGRESEISVVSGYIHYPIFVRWWAIAIYILLFVWRVNKFMKWRTKRLQQEKAKLEKIVSERTSELAESNAQLSVTLSDLKRTQDDLVRMERTATAGKLTQGLIDRILNPINYINNFSKLTSGLAKDLRENIEDEKEHISEDNYEDCEDILDMMTTNLSKIEEHGVNTTRTLRAMEAILNSRVGTVHSQDICTICRQVMSAAKESHAKAISEYNINMCASIPDKEVMVDMDSEAITKCLLSIIANSVYAVQKKYVQEAYDAKISLSVEERDTEVELIVEDNGIGIEDTIKEKVFDPFFTTKTTGEAAGVGLYLTRELIHDHKGQIVLDSEKDKYCKFTIILKK